MSIKSIVMLSQNTYTNCKNHPQRYVELTISIVGRNTELEHKDKDLVFINYTFKRFEGLTQRGMLKMNNTST